MRKRLTLLTMPEGMPADWYPGQEGVVAWARYAYITEVSRRVLLAVARAVMTVTSKLSH